MPSDNPEVRDGHSRVDHLFSATDELALLVDAVQDYGLMVLSPRGDIRSWNRGAAIVFGYSADEVIGNNFSLFYPPDDIAKGKPKHELEVASRDGRVEDEGWRLRKDGTRFWVNTIITALRDESGRLVGFGKVTRDLTERRESDERLRRNEEMFRLLVGSVRDYAIFMLDAGGHIATWNQGAQRIKGYSANEIIGRHFSTFYTPEDLATNKPARELEYAKEHGVYEEEGWRLRKDGTRFWANVVITAVFDSKRVLRGFAKVTRDITDRKKAEETQRALLQQREARLQAEEERRQADAAYRSAQEANRAKDEFLMTLSHELRTPMTAILGWARLLPTLATDDAMFREAVASIARSAEIQATLIDDVLDLSRIVSGKLRLTLDNVDVTRTIEAALQTVRASADAKSISITTSFASGLGTIVADATRLQQVIWNLLSNAVKFTNKGGQIDVAARRTASQLQIKISDSGEGISPSFLPHIFEPFRQAENPSTRVHGGLGLGLSIVRYIVEAHGGTITAESEGRGKGATFTVTMPIRSLSISASQVSWTTPTPESRRIQGGELTGIKVLIVDDDREGREMVRAVLRQASAEVAAASSAAEALKALENFKPDVILSDIAMPEIDGFAFERELRNLPEFADMKVIALSAFPMRTVDVAHSNFAAYLTKPIDPVELVENIAKIVKG